MHLYFPCDCSHQWLLSSGCHLNVFFSQIFQWMKFFVDKRENQVYCLFICLFVCLFVCAWDLELIQEKRSKVVVVVIVGAFVVVYVRPRLFHLDFFTIWSIFLLAAFLIKSLIFLESQKRKTHGTMDQKNGCFPPVKRPYLSYCHCHCVNHKIVNLYFYSLFVQSQYCWKIFQICTLL